MKEIIKRILIGLGFIGIFPCIVFGIRLLVYYVPIEGVILATIVISAIVLAIAYIIGLTCKIHNQ